MKRRIADEAEGVHRRRGRPSAWEVAILTDGVRLEGTLRLPEDATGLVIFAHGSGSSRFSSRNRYVADLLNDAALGTLLFDLLSAEEQAVDERTRHLRFDIPLLTRRLTAAVDWAGVEDATNDLPIGLFGASTGAAAALSTAAERPEAVAAVVSRGGRPDLAANLPAVQAPTLLIVGEHDEQVIELNEQAAAQLRCQHELRMVPGASHLFEEPGTLTVAAELARDWFVRWLR